MADLRDLGTIANDFEFQQRCMQAAFVAAFVVMAEGSAEGVAHPARVDYAQSILNGSVNLLSITRSILANPTIAAEADVTQSTSAGYAIPDGDIQFTIQNIFNYLAGVVTS